MFKLYSEDIYYLNFPVKSILNLFFLQWHILSHVAKLLSDLRLHFVEIPEEVYVNVPCGSNEILVVSSHGTGGRGYIRYLFVS